ncbi:MAG: phospho-N-acetylmuramoyl-pentapeptide-transferase, partial [Clostridiales bacterium]|nr:phospho-N-acetylmuramoyl-pentapeptide-transferase [Clostridiales bacterium]
MSNIIIFIVAFALTALFGPIYIPLLRKLKIGQTVRNNGPKTHLAKNGIPTIGGLIFLTPISLICLYLFFTGLSPQIIPMLFITLAFGLVGFWDDFIKVVKKRKDGLYWYQKLAALVVIAIIFSYYISEMGGTGTLINIALFGWKTDLDLGWFFIPFTVIVLLGTANGVNFSDGIDGLCSSVTFIVLMFFAAVSI